MLQHSDCIELQSGNLIIKVYHALPSDIRIIDKRARTSLSDEIENIFIEANLAIDEMRDIIDEVSHKIHKRRRVKELENRKEKEVIIKNVE